MYFPSEYIGISEIEDIINFTSRDQSNETIFIRFAFCNYRSFSRDVITF